ncbi:hypothetical protein ACLB2K_048427 [Fragaria x ananassa]
MDGYSTQSREDAPIPDCRLADNDNSNTLDLLDILQTCYFDRSDLDTACLDMSPINDQPWSIWNTPHRRKVFERMRTHGLRMNPAKCVFGEPCHQEAFDRIKEYLENPPVLVPPKPGIPLKLYISASKSSIAGLLAQDDTNQEGRTIERTIYYLSRTLLDAETSTDKLSRAGISLVSPSGGRYSYSFQLEWRYTTNQAEYEAVIIGLELLLDVDTQDVDILDDSLLVINQLLGLLLCLWNGILRPTNLLRLQLELVWLTAFNERMLKVEKRTLPSFMARKENNDEWLVARVDALDVDWRQPIMDYLINPSTVTDKQIRFLVLNYVLKSGELLRKGENGIDFLCVYGREAKRIMCEVHLGVCASYQAGPKMRWFIRRHGFYWPTILKDCISFSKGCLECQAHGPIQHIPNIPMQPIIKPWLGRGWALDFVGVIHPYYFQQHKFILVGTNFFTNWVEAEPVKEASAKTVCQFIFRNIICRQAEASNKNILSILKQMLAENPHDWHNELDNTLWAYKTSKRTLTETTSYALMFGHDVVLPLEINVRSLQVRVQHQLLGEDYVHAMWQEHEKLDLT